MPSATASAPGHGRTALLGMGVLVIAALIGVLSTLARDGGPKIKPAPELAVLAPQGHESLAVEAAPSLQATLVLEPLQPAPPVVASALPVSAVVDRPAPKSVPKPVLKPVALKPLALKSVALKPVPKARPAAVVEVAMADTDVAILTAVLAQSPRHAGEATAQPDSPCKGKDCRHKNR